jgi:predicted kinase
MKKIPKKIDWTFPFCPLPDESLDWEALVTTFDWIQAMQGVPQDPIFHAEGDVLVHTHMVLQALIDLEEWKNMDEKDRNITFLACLFHDVAKPICTQIESDGHISSPKHAKVGELIARQLMYKQPDSFGNIDFETREIVCQLVRYHGLPLWFQEKENIELALYKASLHTPMNLLALVAEADVRGRICDDQANLLERISFFRMYCQEADCYEQAKSFADDHTRFMYFQKGDISPEYPFFDETTFEVVLLSGLPGAGKDAYIQQHFEDWKVISLDAIREQMNIDAHQNQGQVIQAGQEKAKELLRKKTPFVWNATNLQKDRRKKLIDLFSTYKARTTIVYIESSFEKLLEQNQEREDIVKDKIILRMLKKLEIPTKDEAQKLVYYT